MRRTVAFLATVALPLAGCATGPSTQDLLLQACDVYDRLEDSGSGDGGSVITAADVRSGQEHYGRVAEAFARVARRDSQYTDLAEAATAIERALGRLEDVVQDWGEETAGWPEDVRDRAVAALEAVSDEEDHLKTQCRIARAD